MSRSSPLQIAIGAPEKVNTTLVADQTNASVAAFADGRYVVVWEGVGPDREQRPRSERRLSQIYNSSGSTSGPDQPVNATVAGLREIRIHCRAGGRWLAIVGDVLNGDVMQQRYNAVGAKVGSEQIVNTTIAGSQLNSEVTAIGGSSPGWLVTWHGNGTTTNNVDTIGIYQQRFSLDGTREGSEILVNSTTAGSQDNAVVTAIPGGGWIVVWRDQSASHRGCFQQVYDNYGIKVGGKSQVSSALTATVLGDPAVTMLSDGRWVVTWSALLSSPISQNDVYQQVFNADGTKNGTEILVNAPSSANQGLPSVVALAGGDWIVMWQGAGTGANATIAGGIFQQQFHLNNAPSRSPSRAQRL